MAVSPAILALLSDPTVRSIFVWQIFGQLIGAGLDPIVTEVRQAADSLAPNQSLSPADAVDAVIKGHWSADQGAAESSNAGINRQRFDKLVEIAGEPLALELLTEAWRRNLIPKDGLGPNSVSLQQGIYESRLKNKWLPVIESLQFRLADPSVVIEGWLRAVIGEPEARTRLYKAGVDDDTATLMYKAAGRPPSPQELADMLHRGLIPEAGEGPDVLSLRQGFLETDLKNKWYEKWRDLQTYLPPPRTITAMIREGALTDAQGVDLFKKAGLPDDLVAAYLAAAHHQKTAPSRELVKSDILAAYVDGFFTADQATTRLAALGWSADDAALELALAQFRRGKSLLDSAVNKIKGYYIARKITKQTAVEALGNLGQSSDGVSQLLAVWDVERGNLVQRLTAVQWADAAAKTLISDDQALSQLVGLGYSPFEAWVFLALHHGKAPLTTSPPASDVPTGYIA